MNRVQVSILALYFLLLISCVVLVTVSDTVLGPSVGARLAEVATDGIKLTIAALLGALSTLLGASK